jgi:DNA polymerase elongation subunit (family B)
MFKQNLSLDMLIDVSYILSYSAKWLGNDDMYYEDCRTVMNDQGLCASLKAMLDEADMVVAHNAKRFDVAVMNARMAHHGMTPPSPYRIIDTLLVAKRQFRFTSNKLEHLAEMMGCTPKDGHVKFPGFKLWEAVMQGNEEAWEEMRTYNIQDVITLEELYIKMLPWIPNHPNIAAYLESDRPVCTRCGSEHIHYRGHYMTQAGKYKRFVCLACGGWGRERTSVYPKELRKALMMPTPTGS